MAQATAPVLDSTGFVGFDFQPNPDTSGTFSLSGGDITFMALFSRPNIVASSQLGPNIDSSSFVTFDKGVIVDWSISGAYT